MWIVTAQPSVTIENGGTTVADEVDLQGSRIFWSTQIPDPGDPDGEMLRQTFSGTVNGDYLAGTVFTTGGNMTVRGTRQ